MWRPILFLLCFVQTSTSAEAQISSEFEAAALVFKITVSNPSSNPRSGVQVGVRSDVHGDFLCLSAAQGLISIADYPVAFHVRQRETMVDADPILALPPKETATFTVSLYPNATGSCGAWYSQVSAVVKFDNGDRLVTEPAYIDARQVEAVRRKSPKRDEVLAMVAHRSPILRIQGIEGLAAANVDSITAQTVLRARYSDPVATIRIAAYDKTTEMQLAGLIPDLIARFDMVVKPGSQRGS